MSHDAITRTIALLLVVGVLGIGILGAVGLAEATPDDDEIVVTFDGEVVIAGDVGADDRPATPWLQTETSNENLSVDGDRIVTESTAQPAVVDGNPVQVREHEDPAQRLIVNESGVVNGTLTLENEFLVTETGANVTVDGEDVVYPNRTTTDVSLAITGVNEPAEGEELIVDYTLTNAEFGTYEDDIELTLIGGTGWSELSTETVEGGETSSFQLSNETADGDTNADEVAVIVPGEDDETVSITIEASRYLLEIEQANSPATGDILELETDMQRIGTIVPSRAGDELVFDVTVGGQEQPSITRDGDVLEDAGGPTIEYDTTASDGGSIPVEISSQNISESASTTARILTESTLADNVDVEFVDRNWPEEGETLEMTGQIGYLDAEDIPDQDRSYTIEFYVDGTHADEQEIELTAADLFEDSPVTETFSYDTVPGDAPRVDAELRGPSRTDTARPRVNGSGFDIDLLSIDNPVNESETFEVEVEIFNSGDAAADQDVRLRIDNAVTEAGRTSRSLEDRSNVSLDVGESATVRLRYETDEDDFPAFDAVVRTDDDEVRERVQVRPREPFFDVTQASAGYDADEDEVAIAGTINNTGLEPDEQFVEFLLDDEIVTIERLSLEPWEEIVHRTSVDAPEDGRYDLTVETQNASYTEPNAVTVDRSEAGDDEADPVEPAEGGLFDVDLPVSLETVALGLLGVLVAVLSVLAYRRLRSGPSVGLRARLRGVRERLAARFRGVIAAIRAGDVRMILKSLAGLIGLGPGTLYVQNELPREAAVSIRCETDADTVVEEAFSLDPDERQTVGDLPSVEQFRIDADVDDIASHQEVFQGISGDVGVVLKPEGILIANLR